MIFILESYTSKTVKCERMRGKKDILRYAKTKNTLPLCSPYEEDFEGHIPFLKRTNKKGNRALTQTEVKEIPKMREQCCPTLTAIPQVKGKPVQIAARG